MNQYVLLGRRPEAVADVIQARIRDLDLPEGLAAEERARRIFQALRSLGS
jgi:hypothetical protein